MRRLRVAQIVTRMDIGGVPDHVMTLVRGLSPDMDVTVICNTIDAQHERDLSELGVPFICVRMERLLSLISDLRGFQQLRRILRDGRFDIVHSHMSKAALLGGIAAVTTGIPVTINTAHNLGFLALPNPAARLLFWVYDRLLFALTADAVITVSERVRDGIVRGGIVGTSKVVSIHNGIDVAKFSDAAGAARAIRSEFGVGPEDVLVVTVARLVWFKGLHDLLDAAALVLAQFGNVRFLIAGTGSQRDELAARASALGIGERVIFAGERRDVPSILAAADVFALSSVSEGLPISILEAMAAGVAVVATDVGGISELVEEGVNGYLVPARDPPAFAERLCRLAGDAALRRSFGASGRTRARLEFSPERMVMRTADLYETLITSRTSREPVRRKGRNHADNA
ncbi:glycosyltransferase [Rhizobium sp. LjRoot254]|uniref:glycosyltransferase n=1 Tax=Rhizobium sp. LjRoot254 TaxID=3342297 RepID=UPI003ECFDB29